MGAMYKKIKISERIKLIITSFIVSIGLTISFINKEYVGEELNDFSSVFLRSIYILIRKVTIAMSGNGIYMLFIFFALCFFSIWFLTWQESQPNILFKLLAFVLALFALIGRAYEDSNSITIIYTSSIQIVKSVIIVFSWYIIFIRLIQVFYQFINSDTFKLKLTKKNRLVSFYQLHPFLFPFLFLLIMWLPYTLINYPGILTFDALGQIRQFMNYETFTTHHTPFHTVVIGGFAQLGIFLGSANLGLFLFVLMQNIAVAGALAYSLYLMDKMKIGSYYKLFTAVLFATIPIFTSYVNLITKDILYSACFLFFILAMIEYYLDPTSFWQTRGKVMLWIVSSSLLILFRNNGKFVVIPVLAIWLIIQIKESINQNKFKWRAITGVISPYVIATIVNSVLITSFGIINNSSVKETLSLPFQQTARYVKEASGEVTLQEEEAIDSVLDFQAIGKEYNENISDPVKDTYKLEASKEDLKNYFEVWWNQFLKHPRIYFDATLQQNYSIFVLSDRSMVFYSRLSNALNDEYPERTASFHELGFKENKKKVDFQLLVYGYCRLVNMTPVLGILTNLSLYILLSLFLFAYAVKDKRYRTIVILLPLMVSLLIIIAGPVITGQIRYALPIIYSIPVIIAFYTVDKPSMNNKRK